MRQRGFSLLEVLIAGALMCGLALAAYELLGNVSKSAGELEKRARFRDLIDDVRFVFSEPRLCEEAMSTLALSEGAPFSLTIRPGFEIAKDKALPDYGLTVTSLTFRNVRTFPSVQRYFVKPGEERIGIYTEETTVADVFLAANYLGSNHGPKPQTAVRVALVRRRGGINETICYGSHEVARGRAVPESGAVANGRVFAPNGDSNGNPGPVRGGGAGQGGGHAVCEISDPQMLRAHPASKLAHGARFLFFDTKGERFEAFCENGTIDVLRRR